MSIAGTCAFILSFSIALEKMNLLTEGLADQPPPHSLADSLSLRLGVLL